MFTFTGTTTNASAVITAVASTTGVLVGAYVSGAGIPVGAKVASFVVNTSVTMTLAATASAAGITVTHGRQMDFSSSPQSALTVAMGMTVNSVRTFSASPASGLEASFTLSGSNSAFAAAPVSALEVSMALSGKNVSFQASPISTMAMSMALSGKTMGFSANPVSGLKVVATLSGSTAKFSASPLSALTISMSLSGAQELHGMSICDVIDEVLGMWGIFSRCSAPSFAIERAINDINTSMQTVWNHADERNYWSSDTLTITLADGTSSQDLPDNIQNVVGPCRRADNRRPLVPIGTIGELETFADIYLDGETAEEPVAYHIERMNQLGNDPAKCVFHVTPSVDGESMSFLLEVVREAPRFTTNDLRACPVIPIPHRYVESLLLPIARYQASSYYLFRKADQKETIDREYQQARIALGLADPLPGKAGDNKEGVTK